MKMLLPIASALAVASLGAGAANAVVIVSNTTQSNTAFAVSNTDLLQTSLAGTTATGSFSREGEVGLSALTDGSFGAVGSVVTNGPGLDAATADGTNSITYTLTGPRNLTSIATYAGWDQYRGGQSYTVSYATAAAPTTFITLASEYNNAIGEGGGDLINTAALITRSSGFLATNVVAIKFDFNSDLQYGYAGYREIDVSGSAVPEPDVWAMLLAGFGLIGFSLRRRPARLAA